LSQDALSWELPAEQRFLTPFLRFKRRKPHDSALGKVRGIVERRISWLKRLRQLRVRYDRLGVIVNAWITLVDSIIYFLILCCVATQLHHFS
jgi:hypothetical protein